MRVIREYWQCVGKQEIPLKELLDTVDTFLRSRGYSYRRLWSPTHPELSDTELKALFQKIPRPCNPPQVEALFEDVSWFGEEAEPMAYTGRQPFLCSGVRVVHCAGTSFCHVYFYIEVTGPDSPARIREQIWRENAETVRAFMEHCLLLAERAEAALDQPLYDCFGASPDWWLAD